MRKKKRYILMRDPRPAIEQGGKLLFQTEEGYVVRVPLQSAEALRRHALRMSGSVKKFKRKTLK